MAPRENFYLWGTWGARVAKKPFLTQKVDGQVRKVCMGPDCMLALRDDGNVASFGEDPVGLLGLGDGVMRVSEPRTLEFRTPEGVEVAKIADLQIGDQHALALSYIYSNSKLERMFDF